MTPSLRLLPCLALPFAAAILATPAPVRADDGAHAPAARQSAEETAPVHRLDAGSVVLLGPNGNVIIVAGPGGVLLVDDERAADAAEIRAAADAVSTGGVRYVINTHWHLDHSGSNAAFGGEGAVLIAHRNVRTRLAADQFMAAYNRTIPASPEAAWPGVVYDTAMTVHFGGETLTLRHTPAAHTDGDTLVRLERANAVHMGDVFFNGLFPFIDRSSGGGIEGLIAAVDAGLALSDDRTTIVPAHGDLTDRAGLQAYRDMLREVADRVRAAREAGRTEAEVVAMKPAATYALGGDADRFVAAIYDSYANP